MTLTRKEWDEVWKQFQGYLEGDPMSKWPGYHYKLIEQLVKAALRKKAK